MCSVHFILKELLAHPIETACKKLQRNLKRLISIMFPTRNRMYLFAFILFYSGAFSYFALVKYNTFHATAWDLGVFSQSFYTTLNSGAFFYNNLELGTHFHVHFSPILGLLLPFYAIYQSSETLLVLQTFAIALGAVPLYSLAKQELGNDNYSLAFATLYLLYPALHAANLYDFHPEAFTPLFIFSAMYFSKKERWKPFFVLIALSLAIKEDITLVVLGIGLYGLAANRKTLFGKKRQPKPIVVSLITICISISWLFFALYATSQFVKLDGYETLWTAGYTHHTGNVYSGLGGNRGLLGIVFTLLSDPLRIVGQMQYMPLQKLAYLATIFLPLCMTSFLEPSSILLFLPAFLEFTLASNPQYFDIIYHYPLQLTPVVFIAAIHGLRKLLASLNHAAAKPKIMSQLFPLMLTATLVTLFFTTPIVMQNTNLVVGEEHQRRLELLSLVPNSGDPHILTQNDYFPHVCNSRYAYAYWNTSNVEYILVDVASFWFDYQDPPPDEYVAKYGEPKSTFVENIVQYVDSAEFGFLGQANSLLLYQKGFDGNLSYLGPCKLSFDWEHLSAYAMITQDPTSKSSKILLHKTSFDEEKFFWYGPYATMPPGKYEAKFRLKIANTTDKYILTLDVTQNANKTLANYVLFGEDFAEANSWQYFTLHFQLDKLAHNIELRGVNVSNATDIYLDYISVKKTAPP